MLYRIIYWYFNIRTSIRELFEVNPYLSSVKSICKISYECIKNVIYDIPGKVPPHIRWCNTIAVYKNDLYRPSSFNKMKEITHPLFYTFYSTLYGMMGLITRVQMNVTTSWSKTTTPEYKRNSTISLIEKFREVAEGHSDPTPFASYFWGRAGTPYPKSSIQSFSDFLNKWQVVENPFFFQEGHVHTEKIEMDNQVDSFSNLHRITNIYYSVPDSDISIAERTVCDMKKNPIFKEKTDPRMKYLLFLFKTDKFYYSKMIYQSSKTMNVDIPINYKISHVGFMTVEYTTPSLKTPIIIDISRFKFAVGSDILNFTFVYWYLRNRYGNWVDTVFDFDYKLHIIDSELRMVELLPYNYLRMKENDYDICRIYSLIK